MKTENPEERILPRRKDRQKKTRARTCRSLLSVVLAVCMIAAMTPSVFSAAGQETTAKKSTETQTAAVQTTTQPAASETTTQASASQTTTMASASQTTAAQTTAASEPASAAPAVILSASNAEPSLNDYIKSATFTDENGNPITTAKDGQSIKVAIKYEIPAGVISSSNKTITYQLPDGITISGEQSGGVFAPDGTTKVGTYKITTDGLISITFEDSYATGNSISGTVNVSGSASNSSTTEAKTVTIGGSGLTIEPKSSVTHDLYVQKTADTWTYQDGKIHYTVTAYTTAGTEDTINLTDTLTSGGATYDADSFVITGPDGKTLSTAQYPVYINGSTFSIYYLPKLAAGEKYTITYTAAPDWSASTDTSKSVNNKATATSGGDSYTAYGGATLTLLGKTGNFDSTTKQITWTINVNSAHSNLNGYTLSDVLHNPDGTTTAITGDVTVSPQIGGSSTISLPYTFQSDDYNSYTITYTTTPDTTAIGSKTYSNDAVLTKDGVSHTAGSGDVGVTGVGNVQKEWTSEQAVTGKDGANYNWTSTLTVPSSGITTDYFYNDYLDDQNDKLVINAGTAPIVVSGVDGSGNLTTLTEGTDYSISFFYYNAKTQTYTESYGSTAELVSANGKATTFTIRFLKAIPKETYSSLKVTYGTYADYSSITVGRSHTYKNDAQYGYTVDGKTVYDEDTASHKYTKTASIDKQGKKANGGYTDNDFTVDYDAVSGKLSYRLLVNTNKTLSGALTITDTLPAGVDYDASQFEALFYSSEYYKPADLWIDGKDIKAADIVHVSSVVKNQDGTTTVIFTIDDQYGANALSICYGAVITTQKTGTVTYTNTAQIGTDTPVTQNTKVTHKAVSKSAEQGDGTSVSSNIVTYRIVLNPGADDLVAGADTLTLTDTLSYTATDFSDLHLVQDSVKLYNYDATAANGIGAQLDASSISYSYNAEKQQTTFTIPDSKAVVLTYQYYVKQTATSGTATLSNSAQLTGVTGGKDDNQIAVKVNSSSATADQKIMTIYKVDAQNNAIKLPGATFTLSKWENSAWTDIGSYTTNQDGYFQFDAGIVSPVLQPELILCRLTETAAPDGYAVAAPCYFVWGPEGYTTATLTAAMAGDVTAAGASGVQYFLYTGGTMYVQDSRNSIQVRKVWLKPDGTTDLNTHTGITVQLYKDGTAAGDPETLNSGNNWSYTWKNLDVAAAYTIQETVGEDGYAVTYDNNGGISAGTITVKNTGAPVVHYNLPATGGIGLLPFAAGGLLMISIAAFAAIRKKNREADAQSN